MKVLKNKKGLIKSILSIVVFICFTLLFDLNISAAESVGGEELFSEFSQIVEDLNGEIKDKLPNDIDMDGASLGEGVSKLTQAPYIFGVLQEVLGTELSSSLKLLMSLITFLGIAGIFGALKNSFGESAMPSAVKFCTVSVTMAIIMKAQYGCFVRVSEYFEQLNIIMLGMIPITGAAWAMGGNVSTASVGTATMYSFLNISQLVFGKTILPIAAIGTCLAFCGGITSGNGIKRVATFIKKTYLFLIGTIMAIFGAILTTQTTLTAAADSTAARTAKFISSTVIPIVGGGVGDSLRTVATGVQYIKSVLGVGGILLIFLTVLPVITEIILMRMVLLLSSGIAELFGCGDIGGILNELAEVYSVVLAAVAVTCVMFILAFYIFIRTAVAIM